MSKLQTQSGIALVIVLWMLTLLMILALSYSSTTRVETRLTVQLVQSAKANALAEAGVWQAVSELLKTNEEQTWAVNGSVHNLNFAGGSIDVRIQDEIGKIDLNSARTELIYNLLLSLDIDKDDGERLQLLQAILDWRDKDNLKRQFGAEDEQYLTAGYSYGAKDGPFNTLSELQLVIGMTPEIYKKMEPALTIHSHKPGINPYVAPREVLLTLPGVTAELVDDYLLNRNNGEGALISAITGINTRYISKVRGKVFKITSEGHMSGSINRIDAVVMIMRNSTNPYNILSWQENSDYERNNDDRQGI